MTHRNQHLLGDWAPPVPPAPGPRPAVTRIAICLLLAVAVSGGVIGATVIWIARTVAVGLTTIGGIG